MVVWQSCSIWEQKESGLLDLKQSLGKVSYKCASPGCEECDYSIGDRLKMYLDSEKAELIPLSGKSFGQIKKG